MKFLILSALLINTTFGSDSNIFTRIESTAELEEHIEPGANYNPYLGPGLDPEKANTSPNAMPQYEEYLPGSIIESGPFDPIHEQGEIFEEDSEIKRRSKEIVP